MSSIVSSNSDQKTHALVAYVLMVLGLFTAIPLLIGALWAMFTRSGSLGSVYHSHYTNMIRVFWWSVFWWIVGYILIFVGIGFLILGIVWLWALYRTVFGLARIVADEAYPL